ncbi:MAG: HAMP domain-containing histidine kinase [Rhodospirillales bacterium]|nr:HAMP domain-containing histidine kinase [Rhodospirillales bacterium]MDE2200484.1 HAMP domain-containing histidine kinase [Rhodospirillales bacterium]
MTAAQTLPAPAASRPAWYRRLRRRFVPDRLFRSTGARFGVIYAVLFGISAVALAAFLWWSTAGLLDRQTTTAINSDAQALGERYTEGGPAALVDAIDQRLINNVDDDAIYLLVGPDFQRIAGNLERWPAQVTMDVDWAELSIDRAGIKGRARVRNFDLPGNFHLLIGRDVEARNHLQAMLAGALLWAAGIAVALGSVGAWAVRGLFRVTLADVSAIATAIGAGDLTRRVRVSGHGDEFDQLGETINDMLDRIARLMDGVRQVSNAIAHDLRTPITRARARLEDAAMHAASREDLEAAIERAQADLDGVVAVFQALLRIAEIEAGARRSAFAPVDLAPLLGDLAELYEAAAEARGQVLRPDLPAAMPLYGDRDMIQQAIANLLDNALKFSPDGGQIELSATATADGFRIVVADHGPGIPEEDRTRATERFYRGEQARSTPGSGLGLALVQAVATLHGGVLTLEDNAPGLRAVLRLPRGETATPG